MRSICANRLWLILFVLIGVVGGCTGAGQRKAASAAIADGNTATVKTERFDHDPGWDGHNNRAAPKSEKAVSQNFGYSATEFAGKARGEIGGTVWRGSTPASYADRIATRTLDDRLSASGTFAITASSGSSGVFFGWFAADEPDAGRQNSLGIRLSGQGSGCRMTLQLVTAKNQACGTKITPWVVDKSKPRGAGRKFRPTEIANDGTRYTWTLDYDPQAGGGNGEIRFVIRSNSNKPHEFEGKTFTVALPPGYKAQGTRFDRFGLANSLRPGNAMTIYFDDLRYDERTQDFSTDPGWIGVGNHDSYARREEGGVHDFGFSEQTQFAGGAPGELGGTIWRSGLYGYYGDRVQPLSLDDPLEASGKVMLAVGPPDSGVYLGWFKSEEKQYSPVQAGNFLGIKIGGPTRVGHYFLPAYATTQRTRPANPAELEHAPNVAVERRQGPVLVPQKMYPWKLVYDPAAAGGNGAITVTLGEERVTLPLKAGDKAKGARFDRFGLFTTHRGGGYLKIYFDDLTYTCAPFPTGIRPAARTLRTSD